MNPDLEAAAIRVSRERGIPRPLARALDNREAGKPDLENVAPETLAFLGNDLSNAAVSKDDVAGIDNIVEAAQYAAMSPEDRRDSLLGSIKQHGYSPSQLADLKAAGFSPLPEDPDGSTGTFSVDAASALNAKARWPVLTELVFRPRGGGSGTTGKGGRRTVRQSNPTRVRQRPRLRVARKYDSGNREKVHSNAG